MGVDWSTSKSVTSAAITAQSPHLLLIMQPRKLVGLAGVASQYSLALYSTMDKFFAITSTILYTTFYVIVSNTGRSSAVIGQLGTETT